MRRIIVSRYIEKKYERRKQMKIETKELVEQIKVALQEEFVAEVAKEGEDLVLRFVSGQAFRICVEEV